MYHDTIRDCLTGTDYVAFTEDLTFEQKKDIIEQMKEVADKVDKKDSENKRFIAGMATLATIVLGGTVAVLASVLGGNTQIEANDTDNIV